MPTRVPYITESSEVPVSTPALLATPVPFLALTGSVHADPLFSAPFLSFDVGDSPVSVGIADLNADGRPDLAVANYFSHTVSVLLGNGDGTFGAKTDFGAGSGPFSVGIADLNADGRPDLAAANAYSNTVSVLLNRGATPAPIAMGFTLNLTSRGLWVTGYLEPASPFAASDIDIASIRLNGTLSVDPAAPAALGDHDGNGVPDRMVKFNRAAVELTVSEGDSVAVTVTGTVKGNKPFSGTNYIRVGRGMISDPAAGSHLTAGSVTQVRWQTPSGVTVQTVGLLHSLDGGSTWSLIARGQPNTESYDWTVPSVQTDQAKVAVLAQSAGETGDIVDGVLGVSEAFSIEAVVGVGDRGPAQLAIRGATPNPTPAGRLRVEFSLRDGSPARLELVDVAGRVLTTRQVGSLGPGRHALDVSEGRALRPGMYFLRLTQGGSEVRARAAVLR